MNSLKKHNFDNFSKHACKRLNQRTSMSPRKLNAMISQGNTLNLGSKPGINKVHHLFYSEKDAKFFVAVMDNLNGEVITVWFLDYQESLAWRITSSQKAQAKELALAYQDRKECAQMKPSMCRVSAGYADENGKFKSKELLTLPIKEKDVHPLLSLKNPKDIKAYIKNEFKKISILASDVFWIAIRDGKKDEPTIISLEY